MAINGAEVRRFKIGDDPERSNGTRARLYDVAAESSFSIEYIVDSSRKTPQQMRSGDSFGFFLKPKSSARKKFGLDREVLAWFSTHPSFQARDIEALRKVVDDHGSRLSRNFAVLITKYDPATRSEIEFESEGDLSIIHASTEEYERLGLDGVLVDRLFSRDVFDVSGAAVRAADFFGRRELVDRLIADIEAGSGQLGLFGLRKVGKTSLLNRLADKLRNSGRSCVARLDLQWTTAINPSPEYTLWAIGSSIFASHRSIRSIKGLALMGQYRNFGEISNPDSTWELFAQDMQLILASTNRKICILVDEIERLYERPAETQFVRLWRVLRGLDQQYPERLRYVVGGTSPECAETGLVDGEDNPLFNYLRVEYLGPLSQSDSEQLLCQLGSQVGMNFTPTGLRVAFDETGGHPALLRSFGSIAHQSGDKRHDVVDIDASYLESSLQRFGERARPILDQMLSALEDKNRDELDILRSLAAGRLFEYRQFVEIAPEAVERLGRLGLLAKNGEGFSIVRLQEYMLAREQVPAKLSGSTILAPGDSVDAWVVEACVAAGGFAEVYRVRSGEGLAALKVLSDGNLEPLQREVDILSGMRHPAIVRIDESVRISSGAPAVLMEFLNGSTLASFCTPSRRPDTATWRLWLQTLIGALIYIHPRADLVRSLEARPELSSAEFLEWDRAKHGYIHRDIKPENVMVVPERGPVLIDFNISVRAGAPVLTTSGTDGYCPPYGVVWEPSVDLYALGVTFLELACGVRVSNSSIEDLRELALQHMTRDDLNVVDRLLGSPESGVSAREILLSPGRVVGRGGR
jgi:hypothetical protein